MTSEIISPTTIDIVHTYGRPLESQEIGSKIDFKTSYETGWSLWNIGSNFSNNLVFHNGRLHSDIKLSLDLLIAGDCIATLETVNSALAPFASLRLNLEDLLLSRPDTNELLTAIQCANEGEVNVKILIEGLNATFPRLLFVCTQTFDSDDKHSIESMDRIQFTHSNFDFDRAEQPTSSLSYGFVNNPKYPSGVETGFRYDPCNELRKLHTDCGSKLQAKPISMDGFSYLRVSSSSQIPSRVVGANWSRWMGSELVKECSTGTFIIEYVQHSGYWHWGRLLPRGEDFCAIISIINPFADSSQYFDFKLSIYSECGLCSEEDIQFFGQKAFHEITADNVDDNGAWYVLRGEGVGKFNVFATTYFSDLSDGTVEHAF